MNRSRIKSFIILFFLCPASDAFCHKHYKKFTKLSPNACSLTVTERQRALQHADRFRGNNPAVLIASPNSNVVKHAFVNLCLLVASGALLKTGSSLTENSHPYVGGIVMYSALFAFIASRIPAESD